MSFCGPAFREIAWLGEALPHLCSYAALIAHGDAV